MNATESVHAYTSINLNYLPRARVLADSLKKFHPEVTFHLMLSDIIPDWLDVEKEPFDNIIQIEDLGVENWKSWMFKHDVVEMCTAVKPFACLHIMDSFTADKVFYFDPDAVLFSRFDSMIADLDKHSGILTPHVCKPETIESAIVDNEMSCMRHGINNLGFLAVNSKGQGRELVEWWANRLEKYCYDDIPRGLFTDQRWMDFAHVYFDGVKTEVGPQYNVATWNYTTRVITGNMTDGVLVDNVPLCFHHFSGFTNGAAEMMQGKYVAGLDTIEELYSWYRKACDDAGQKELEGIPWVYASYSNGEAIERIDRIMYRDNLDLQEAFADPRNCEPDSQTEKSYCCWVKNNRVSVFDKSNELSFSLFLQSTEATLYGYINKTKKLGGFSKRIINRSIKLIFWVAKKVVG